jgi:hypothetical protein
VRGIWGLAGVLAAAAIYLGSGQEADAAILKASYQFQGNRSSTVAGAPELTDLGVGNRFAFETIDGISRRVLKFPEGNGLALSTAGLVDPRNHSVVVLFRFAEVSGYRRILDFSNSTADDGLYNLNGKVVLYGRAASYRDAFSEGIVFDDSYAQVVLTSAATADGAQQTTVYVNGARAATARTSQGFDLQSGMLRFFQDNTSGPAGGEESAGAVACILLYDGALSSGEIEVVARDSTLCPAPEPAPRRAKALATGEPQARESGRSIVVDTGLTVSCPIGATPCAASGRVDVASERRASAARIRRLGAARFSVAAGTAERVVVRLSERGARALREAEELAVRVSAEIAVAKERGAARAQQVGRIKAPRRPAFRPGEYTGTTSQDLPIFLVAGRTGIRFVYFRWRLRCADGQTHTNTVSLENRSRVRRGRFSFDATLETGGSVRVSGRIRGVHASGRLSRRGPSAFGTRCMARRIRWRARYSGGEAEASR